MERLRTLALQSWLSRYVAFLGVLGAVAAAPVAAAPQFEIPAQSLSAALVALATYADISIGLSGVNLTNRTSRPVTEYHDVADALERMLAGTDLRFEMVDATTWRILPRPEPAAPRPVRAKTYPLVLPPIEEITVTVAKRPIALQTTALSIAAVTGGTFADYGIRSSQEMTSMVAGLTATNQGPGKNKFVVRGLSDGPFIGNTQSTVGVYIDDTRAIYNAPDPNLQLYDIDRIEVIRGPQGTLYGAGSIAGLVRIITRQPVFGKFEAQGEIDGSLVEHGNPAGAVEGMVNVPLVGDLLALRTVAYARHDGGYINNSILGRNRVNDTNTAGIRSAARLRLSQNWTVGTGVIYQSIHAHDTQYFNAAMSTFGRNTLFAEPSKNEFLELNLTVNGDLGWADLATTTAWLSHRVSANFDASLALPSLIIRAPVIPTVFDQHTHYRTINHETRLVSSGPGKIQWLGGFFFSHHDDVSNANLTTLVNGTSDKFYVKNRFDTGTELAAFGELQYHFDPRFSAAVGARVYRGVADVTANNSQTIDQGPEDAVGDNRKIGVTPKAEISFQATPNQFFYIQASQGFRLGGINTASRVTIAPLPGRRPVTVSNFDSDRIWNFEIGSKSAFFDQRLLFNASAFYAIWSDMQADLVRTNGLSFTANLGRAHIKGFETETTFVPNEHWRIMSNLSWSDTRTPDNTDTLAASITSRLPADPKLTATLAAQYQTALSADYIGYANLRYVLTGRANLAVGALPMSETRAYHDINLRLGIRRGQWGLALYVNNLTDNRSNTYAFGNPFSLGRISQVIPLQPRTVGLNLSWAE